MIDIKISVDGKGADVILKVSEALTDKPALNAEIAAASLRFVREFGVQKSRSEHATANRLNARPTGHLERAYRGIESRSDMRSARLLIPRASRLRAAFGQYVLTPRLSSYLTIPVHPAAYGRRAGEFTDLIALRVGPKKSLVLARITPDDQVETMYFLTKTATIPEAPNLIPFREIGEEAADAVEVYIDAAIERRLA